MLNYDFSDEKLMYYEDTYDFFNDFNYEAEDDYWVDPSKYIPRIEGTELEFGITFLSFNYLPILTSRKNGRKVKYYLFDFIKIFEMFE